MTFEPVLAGPHDPEDGTPDEVRCSLIVLNFDERELLLDCVTSMVRAVGPADEIIVVDNGSTDGSAAAVKQRFPAVRVVPLTENRYIFSLNAGLAVARGRFVAFCNNDMNVEENFVDQALDCFVSDDIFAVCSRVLDREGAEQGTRTAGFWRRGLLFYQPLPHTTTTTDCFFAVGGQSFFRRDLLEAIGSTDELFWPMYHEDIELSYRAWKTGYRVVYAPGSVCHHLGGSTSRRVFTASELRSFVRQNELLMVWKDVTDPVMLLEHAFCLLPRLVVAALRRDTATLIGFIGALRRLRHAIRARRDVQALFRRSDREVLDRVSVATISAQARVPGAGRFRP